jgi:hypothetical protein
MELLLKKEGLLGSSLKSSNSCYHTIMYWLFLLSETRGSAERFNFCQNMLLLNLTAPKEGGKGQQSGFSHW